MSNQFQTIKYESELITFTEVPDEISLCLNITGCPCNCEGCFEPWLAEDSGIILTYAVLKAKIDSHPHISCLCFMGGDRYIDQIINLCDQIKRDYPKLKIAMYSGRQKFIKELAEKLDYYKIGPYIPEYGPMNLKTTNQIFYKKENNNWIDITFKFQRKKM